MPCDTLTPLSCIQEEKEALGQSVTSLQQESSQAQATIHHLRGELTTAQTQLATAMEEQKRMYSQLQEVSVHVIV